MTSERIVFQCRHCKGLFEDPGKEVGRGGGVKYICPHCGRSRMDAVATTND